MAADDAPSADPEVTIRTEGDKPSRNTVKRLPVCDQDHAEDGKPYFLVRADGTDANFIRSDQPDMLIPSWKIFEW
jgi:hypothetical protein